VNSTAITRPDANGDDTELWVEIYTTVGTTARTLTITYTKPGGQRLAHWAPEGRPARPAGRR
jgi:hypothetical protein